MSRSSGRVVWSPRRECSPGCPPGRRWPGAAKVAEEIDGGTIVIVVADGGWKYLSTGAYTTDLDEAAATAEQVIYF